MEFLKKFFAFFIVLIVSAVLSLPVKNAISNTRVDASNVDSLRASIGSGSVFAILGGYRSIVADFVWIKSYVAWEKCDVSKCISSMELACAISPQVISFWTEGAGIIAYDVPHWLWKRLPKKMRTQERLETFKRRQATQAMIFIDKGLLMYPKNYRLLICKGQIAVSVNRFVEAEKVFKRAVEVDDGFYARRIYASLLIKNGKIAEGKKQLESILADATPDNPVRKQILYQLESLKQ
ncbi:MAG: hypothetical protein E7035_00405 [Verrucomicrobiaceae bacterium]|nr:hypothetical protein [Verrucomicrobiaceae bacterium]